MDFQSRADQGKFRHMGTKLTTVFALCTATTLAACSTSPMKAIGSINPFSNKLADTDRVFLMAAGSWDRNHDNVVTCDEWKAYATELFKSADANGDGVLDASEWGKLSSQDRMFDTADLAYFDGNKDGKVTVVEMTDKSNPAFRLLDTGNTCSLNGAQIAGARSKTQYDVSGKKPDSADKGSGTDKSTNEALKR